MPSRKVLTTVVGKKDPAQDKSRVASPVRFAVAPTDPQQAKMQEDLRASVEGLLKDTPFRTGALVDLDFTDGTEVTTPNKLGREVQGFIVVDLQRNGGAISIYRETETSSAAIDFARSKSHIKFRSTSTGVKAKVWVW
jgi:hypothetical protein